MSKAKQGFLYAGPFLPLVFFKIWAGTNPTPQSLTFAACVMFVWCMIVLVIAYRWDKPTYFDWVIAIYFAVASVTLILWPGRASDFWIHYAVTGIYACLFSAAFFPPLLGLDPFTYHYAKKYSPKAVWENPVFVRINLIMTYTWSAIFAACILSSLYPSILTRALIPLGLILGFGLPFNLRYPDHHLRKLGLPSLADQRRMAMEEPLKGASSPRPEESPLKESHAFPSREPVTGGNRDLANRKEKIVKVLALNSSPRSEGQSKTELMLRHLVKGMSEAGADVEVVELRKKNVKNCIGCFTCWTKTPGVCIHKDDMAAELYPKWLQADLVVYATPLYHFTLNAAMKAFIERTLPVLEPFFIQHKGKTAHPLRQDHPKLVFLSVAGFPEESIFDQLSSWVNFVWGKRGILVAEIYRPLAEAMLVPAFAEKGNDILEATVQAGREIIESTTVNPETMARIRQPLVEDPKVFYQMGNLMWKTCIQEGITPKEFGARNLVPRPDSLETFMTIMPMGFDPEAAGETSAILQFHFSGEVQGTCHFRIEKGKITAIMGPGENPTLTIDTPFEVWMDIMTGKADGQQMFMQQNYKVAGDFSLLLRMNQLFGKMRS
ncbi:MAG: NAD(P)H-dependent oxidoreductase [Proteobacteria bacterium]|nr:NAD(P)H-dependent oxidoreductase [Pseudomonadota bacterium]